MCYRPNQRRDCPVQSGMKTSVPAVPMVKVIEDEFYEERLVLLRLEKIGFSQSVGRKIYGTFQTMLTADAPRCRAIMRRMAHYGVHQAPLR